MLHCRKTFKWKLAFQNQPRLLCLAGCLAGSCCSPHTFICLPRHLMKSAATPVSWLSRRSVNWLWFSLRQYVIISSKLAFQIEIFRRLLTAASICVTATFSAKLAEQYCMTLSSAGKSSALTSLVSQVSDDTLQRFASGPNCYLLDLWLCLGTAYSLVTRQKLTASAS